MIVAAMPPDYRFAMPCYCRYFRRHADDAFRLSFIIFTFAISDTSHDAAVIAQRLRHMLGAVCSVRCHAIVIHHTPLLLPPCHGAIIGFALWAPRFTLLLFRHATPLCFRCLCFFEFHICHAPCFTPLFYDV